MTDRLNWNLIESCVKKIQVDCGIEKEERAFLSFIASEIIGISIEDAHDSITDGALDRGVDLFFYDQYSHTLYLLNTKYTKRFENSEKRFPFSEVDKIKSFISDFIDQNLRKNANVSEDLFERCSYVWQTYTHSEFSIQVYFCSNMLDFDHVKILSMKNEIEKDYVYAYSLCGERIVHDYIRRRKSSINSTIKFYGKQYFERSDGYYRGLIATVRAIDFVNILRDPNDALLINDAIFEDNIRKYLGKKNAVNSSIYETATGDRGVDFWYLNNGITMVCQRFSFNSGIPDPEVELSDIQIVNGGQTSNALFEVFKNDPGKLENIYLIVRICETQNEEIKLKIAEATNNQNKILGRDLRSNDDVQKKIEYLLKNNGITYLRKKPKISEDIPRNSIDALKAGQAYMSFVLGEPDKAKTNSNQIFGEYYSSIFHSNLDIEELMCAALLLKILEEEKRDIKKNKILSKIDIDKKQCIIEGIYHVLYVIGLMCEMKEVFKNDFPKVRNLVKDAIYFVESVSMEYRKMSYYRFFRTVYSKEVLKSKLEERRDDLFGS